MQILGLADEVQFLAEPVAAQTANLLQLRRTSAGADLFVVQPSAANGLKLDIGTSDRVNVTVDVAAIQSTTVFRNESLVANTGSGFLYARGTGSQFIGGVAAVITDAVNDHSRLYFRTEASDSLTGGLSIEGSSSGMATHIAGALQVGIPLTISGAPVTYPETAFVVSTTAPYITLWNRTHEDSDGGRESRLNFKGEQSGGEETTLARIQVQHDGAADDQKGEILFYTNDGADADTPTERMRIDSAGQIQVGHSNASVFLLDCQRSDLVASFLADLSVSSVSGRAFAIGATGEGFSRCIFYTNSFIGFGSGAATRDVFIGRNSANTIGIGTAYDGTGEGHLKVGGNLTIGSGVAATDYTLTFNGETNDGVLTWMEDEDYFKFGDDVVGETLSTPQNTTTLGVGVTTFAITSNLVTLTGDGGGNTVATITGGLDGQLLTIIFVDGNITITDTDAHTANTVDLAGTATDLTSADDTTLQVVYDGTSWYETSRSVN
jgi:hypothetical protein